MLGPRRLGHGQNPSPQDLTQFQNTLFACFYFECVKVSGWTVFKELRIAEPEVLPIVLARLEVQKLLAAVREARFSTCLRLMCHCGLRVGEAVGIQVRDIHGRETPPRLHIRNGKGGKDRYVPLAPAMVQELRRWWCTHQNRQFLFPSPGRAGPTAPSL